MIVVGGIRISLKLGLQYVQQDSFLININLAVSQFQFFQPDAAIRAEEKEVYDPVMCMNENIYHIHRILLHGIL